MRFSVTVVDPAKTLANSELNVLEIPLIYTVIYTVRAFIIPEDPTDQFRGPNTMDVKTQADRFFRHIIGSNPTSQSKCLTISLPTFFYFASWLTQNACFIFSSMIWVPTM